MIIKSRIRKSLEIKEIMKETSLNTHKAST